MNCSTCGLDQPDKLNHKNLDDCQIALVAAQDAVRQTIQAQLDRIKESQDHLLQNAKEKGEL